METDKFLGYIGTYKLHDGRIKKIIREKDIFKVIVESYEKEEFYIQFYGVKSIKSFNPEGMILYGVCEMKTEDSFRKFCFVNCDEERDEYLDVVAMSYKNSIQI